ncbi:MAG: HNH endonuclease [Candidatus Xenobiia bacterium LiM19]
MTQCMNATELHMNDTVSTVDDTVSHVDNLDLKHGLSSEEVHKRALAVRKLYGKAEKALTFWMVEMDERKLYRDFGCSNVFQYASRYLNLGEHNIAEILRTGKALSQLPLLSEAFEKGQISSSHVREISRVATKDTEEYWCDTARGKTVREVEKLVAFTPKGGLPGMKNTIPQPARSMTPAISVESAIPSAQIPASAPAPAPASAPASAPAQTSAYVLKNTGAAETLQKESAVPEMTIQHQGSVKYHEKLVVDLDAEEMSVLKDAFTKAQKESGKRDRASLLLHIAKAFLEGCLPSGKRRKPRYQIVLHRHLPSGLAWCDTLKGERPVSPEILEKALCDAEIVQLDEPESPTWDPTGHPTGAPTGDQSIEKGHNTYFTPVAADGKEAARKEADRKETDIQKEANEYVNEQYMRIKAAKRKGHKPRQPSQHSRISCKSLKKEGRAIPAALKKKVLLRDGCACQAPGCGRKIFLSIHHLTAFALCGIHSISGLLTLCSACHAIVHEGMLSVEGEAPHRLIWRDGKGRVICCREAGQIRSSCQ